jgi:hypothetical protein
MATLLQIIAPKIVTFALASPFFILLIAPIFRLASFSQLLGTNRDLSLPIINDISGIFYAILIDPIASIFNLGSEGVHAYAYQYSTFGTIITIIVGSVILYLLASLITHFISNRGVVIAITIIFSAISVILLVLSITKLLQNF